MEESINVPDMKKIYMEYLEEDHAASAQSINLAQSCAALAKYLGVRLAMSALTYPFESTILLRQISSLSANYSDYKMHSVVGEEEEDISPKQKLNSPTLEEQIEAYEKYLLRPQASIRPLLEETADGSHRPVLTSDTVNDSFVDPLGYITKPPATIFDPHGLVIAANTKLPLVLDKRLSIFGSLSQVINRHGFFSLWQGKSANSFNFNSKAFPLTMCISFRMILQRTSPPRPL